MLDHHLNENDGYYLGVTALYEPNQEDGKVEIERVENEQALDQRIVIFRLKSEVALIYILLRDLLIGGSKEDDKTRIDDGRSLIKHLSDQHVLKVRSFLFL